MHALHHGREIHCVQLLQAPGVHQAVCVVTGGEDCTLRSFLFHPSGATGMVSWRPPLNWQWLHVLKLDWARLDDNGYL